MKKIPTLFLRDERHQLTGQVNPDCLWVLDGEGVPTAKWVGTACMYLEGELFKRHTVATVQPMTVEQYPSDFFPAQPLPEPNGKHPGWLPTTDNPNDKWYMNGLQRAQQPMKSGQTYELCGPKIQGNRHKLDRILLIEHGLQKIEENPRTFGEIVEWMSHDTLYEGIVWHHPDGRMAKIKKRDFNIPW